MKAKSIIKKAIIIFIGVISLFITYRLLEPGLLKLHQFLALTKPVDAKVLVVEGWLFDYMLDAAVEQIRNGKYAQVITTGKTKRLPGSSNSAEYCKKRLVARGIDASIIQALPAANVKSHNTYYTALAIKDWLKANRIKAVNVFTGGPHGRKTYIIFKKALGEDIRVGVISCPIKHYPVRWWTSLRGLSVTLRYLAGYFYAVLWSF